MKSLHLLAILNRLKRLLAFLLAFLFTVILSSTIVGYLLLGRLTDPNAYHDVIDQGYLSEQTSGALVDVLLTSLQNTSEGPIQSDKLRPENLELAARILLPASWFKDNLHLLVDASSEWLNSEELLLPDLTLDLTPIVIKLRSSDGALAILPLFQNTRSCSQTDTSVIVLGDALISCLPPGQDVTILAQNVAEVLADAVPETVSLVQLYNSELIPVKTVQDLHKLRSILQAGNPLLAFNLRLSLLILVLYALLNSSSPSHLFQRLARPLYLTGGLLLFLFALLAIYLQFGLPPTMRGILPFLQPDAQNQLVGMIRLFIRGTYGPWLLAVVGMFACGLGSQLMAAGMSWFQARQKEKSISQDRPRQRIRRQFR